MGEMNYLQGSNRLLIAALLLLLLAIISSMVLDGGINALSAIGGVYQGAAPEQTVRLMLAIDFAFPVFYGAGLFLFIIGLASINREKQSDFLYLLPLCLGLILIAVIADFTENGINADLMLKGLAFSGEAYFATLIKFGCLALLGPLASMMIIENDILSGLLRILFRYLLPINLAVVTSGLFPILLKSAPFGFIGFMVLIILYNRQRLARA